MPQAQRPSLFALQLTGWLLPTVIAGFNGPLDHSITTSLACPYSSRGLLPSALKKTASAIDSTSPTKDDRSLGTTPGIFLQPVAGKPFGGSGPGFIQGSFYSSAINPLAHHQPDPAVGETSDSKSKSIPPEFIHLLPAYKYLEPVSKPHSAAPELFNDLDHPSTYSRLDDCDQPSVCQSLQTRAQRFQAPDLIDPNLGPGIEPFRLKTIAEPDTEIRSKTALLSDDLCKSLLKVYNLEFKKKMDLCPSHTLAEWKHATFGSIDNLPALIISFPAQDDQRSYHEIRLAPPPSSGQRNSLSPSEALRAIEPLIKWIILKTVTWLRDLGKNHDQICSTHDMILTWLLNEFFNPDHSLPVFGPIKERGPPQLNAEAFGPLQTLLIKHITSDQSKRNYLKTAINILGIWWKNFDIPMWKNYFFTDQLFWDAMKKVAESSGRFMRKSIKKRKYGFVNSSNSLGNFCIFDLKSLPLQKSKKPKSSVTKNRNPKVWEQILDPVIKWSIQKIKKEMVTHFRLLQRECLVSLNSFRETFSDVKVGLIKKTSKEGSLDSYVIRILDSKGYIIHPKETEDKLMILLDGIERYLTALMCVTHSEGYPTIPQAHINLFRWLKMEIFEPEDSLPVFGKVKKIFNTFEKQAFRCIQKYIIGYFSEDKSDSECEQIISAILGYWYKSHHDIIWEKNFGEDLQYWKFMAYVINKGLILTPTT